MNTLSRLLVTAAFTLTVSACGGSGVDVTGDTTGDTTGDNDVGSGTGTTSPGVAADTTTPNILLIISDDQGLDASAQYSVSQDLPDTPVIDALAARGIVFDNAWATPSCTTTRGSIITGQHGVHSGIDTTPSLMDTSTLTLQRYLSQTAPDYKNAVIGKWHLAGGNFSDRLDHPNQSGIDYYAGTIGGTIDSYTDWDLTTNGVSSSETTYHTTAMTDLAIDWIAGQDDPWFLWLAYVAPHAPFHLPPENLHTRNLPGTESDIESNPRPYYLAAIEAMDTEIGRLLDSLPADTRDNTLIVFLGDNGTPRAVIDTAAFEVTHGKDSLYEGGINVPLVVSGFGVTRQNEREDALINTVDLFATISEAAGVPVPTSTDGESFLTLLGDAAAGGRNFNYSEFVGGTTSGWTVRNNELKLMVLDDGSRELYHLLNDPREEVNLIDQPEYQTDIEALEAYGAGIRAVDDADAGAIDITGATLNNQALSCSAYANSYTADATDVARNLLFAGELDIRVEGEQCVFATNAIPNHDFNDASRAFPNEVSEQSDEYRIPINPQVAPDTTPLSLTVDNAILLNGVKIDILAAGCFGVGDGRVGCDDPNQPWRYDPLAPGAGFLVDSHNAHSQPDGTYHYHGEPDALYASDEAVVSPVVGFAADGFAIFGSYIEDDGNIRQVLPSYRLRTGNRPEGPGNPGGVYDGTYRDDYEYVEGLGDLDECNGRTVDGQYRYHMTSAFPYAPGCYKGVPDPSFTK